MGELWKEGRGKHHLEESRERHQRCEEGSWDFRGPWRSPTGWQPTGTTFPIGGFYKHSLSCAGMFILYVYNLENVNTNILKATFGFFLYNLQVMFHRLVSSCEITASLSSASFSLFMTDCR